MDHIRYWLADIKSEPKLTGGLVGRTVRIWSGERKGWWRPNAAGYTNNWSVAWRLPFEEAFAQVEYSSADKQIAFEVVE